MNLSQRLRAFAINDLQRFCSPAHYSLREHDPVADRELTQPLLEKFVSLELTPRELAAAQALGDLATYEISSRTILASAIPVRDAGVPPIETGMTENQERQIAGRFEVYRRSALVYARAVNDDLLIEYFQRNQQSAIKPQAATADSAYSEAPSVSPAQIGAKTITHKLRKNSLDAPIRKSIDRANSLDTGAVFVQLRALALAEEIPFTGEVDGAALWYTKDNGKPAKLTKNALEKRLKSYTQ
jgi:hypothetical protein